MKRNCTVFSALAFGMALTASAAVFTPTADTSEKMPFDRASMKATSVNKAKAATPRQAEAEDTWEAIGKGQYTDMVFSTLAYAPQTMEVEFEKSTTTAGRYRILAPYKNWKDPKGEFTLTFNEAKMTPIVFDVVDSKYVLLHPFNTGYTLQGADGGEISCKMNAWGMIGDEITIQDVIEVVPESLAKYKDGYITSTTYFTMESTKYAVFLVDFSEDTSGSYLGNSEASFAIMMPGAKEPDPNDGWKDAGTASFTDVYMHAIFPDNVAESTFDVPLQQSETTPGIYRLVNPYKYWENPAETAFTVSDGHYMVIHTENAPDAWIENTTTGVTYNGQGGGMIEFYSQVADVVPEYGYDAAKSQFPAAIWANFKDNTLTYPSTTFSFSGQEYFNFGVSISGNNESFWPVKSNTFKIVFKGGDSGVDGIVMDSNVPAEYFTLDGMRVANPEKGMLLIKRQGSNVSKVLVR